MRRAIALWVVLAATLPLLCGAWPWGVRWLASALVGGSVWRAAAPLRLPDIGVVRRILRRGTGDWLLFTPLGVHPADLDHALRLGSWGWWLQFKAHGSRVWVWASAAGPDRTGYRRLARELTARWT